MSAWAATLAQKRASSQSGLAIARFSSGQLLVRDHRYRMHDVTHEERRRVDHSYVALRVDDLEVVGVRGFERLTPLDPGDLQGRVRSKQPVPAARPLGREVRGDEMHHVGGSAVGDDADDE